MILLPACPLTHRHLPWTVEALVGVELCLPWTGLHYHCPTNPPTIRVVRLQLQGRLSNNIREVVLQRACTESSQEPHFRWREIHMCTVGKYCVWQGAETKSHQSLLCHSQRVHNTATRVCCQELLTRKWDGCHTQLVCGLSWVTWAGLRTQTRHRLDLQGPWAVARHQ